MTFILLILLFLILYFVTVYNSLYKLNKLIKESEDKASKRYKDAIKTYNSYIEQYPSKIVAKLCKFKNPRRKFIFFISSY